MEDLAQHILDLAVNSLEAKANSIEINIAEDTAGNIMEFSIRDNGRGIKNSALPKVMDPFYTTKKQKHIGLGVPLLDEAVQRCGGTLEIRALPRRGTMVRAAFPRNHLDRAPLGDIAGTLISLLTGRDDLHLKYTHRYNGLVFSMDTAEVKIALGIDSLQAPAILLLLEEHLNNKITELRRETGEKFGRTG